MLPNVNEIPASLTAALNEIIAAHQAGNLKALSLSALVAAPVPDSGGTALVPIARMWGGQTLWLHALLSENRMLELRVLQSTMVQREQMAAAEEKAAERGRKPSILDANGHPVG